jgi:NAD(P)-dependent dehydrogenase (short-subunit alcohol dehydrogenase family)
VHAAWEKAEGSKVKSAIMKMHVQPHMREPCAMGEFEGRTVLITGGSSGIGLGTAKRLVEAGADVVLAARDGGRLDKAVKELDAEEHVLAVPADVADTGDLDRVVSAARDRFGRLDGVFANAGVAVFGRGADASEADFDQTVGVNLKGVFFTIQKALPLLADGGAIVVNASWLTHRGMAFTPLYSASKAAVQSLARTLAADLAPRGIRVNSVSPGFIQTPMFDGISPTEQAREGARGQVPLGRLGQPADVADAVLFLLSARASYVTGQDLLVDGGLIRSIPLG